MDRALQQWLETLDGRNIGIDFAGFPAYLQLPPDWQTTPQTDHSRYVCYALTAGQIWYRIDQSSDVLRAGDMLLVAPGHHFQLWADSQFTRHAAWRCRLILPDGGPSGYLHLRGARGVSAAFSQAIEAAAQAREPVIWRSALQWALSLLLEAQPQAGTGRLLNPHERKALQDWLDQHRLSWPSPAELAAVLDLNPDYFARIFKRSYGISPREWLITDRIRFAAAELALTAATIEGVALATGYRDATLFCRQFKQVTGQTPGRWRQTNRI